MFVYFLFSEPFQSENLSAGEHVHVTSLIVPSLCASAPPLWKYYETMRNGTMLSFFLSSFPYYKEHVIQLRKLGKRTGRHPEAVQLASSRAALFTYFPLWGESASTYFTNFHLMFLFYCNITSRGSRICLPKISFLGLLC